MLTDPHPGRRDHIHWAVAQPQPCGALLPPVQDPGWECSGRDLIVVARVGIGGLSRPIVLPRRALEIIDPEAWWETPLQDFTGGDHAHLVVSREPGPAFRSDGALMQGAAAWPVKMAGFVEGDDPFSYGPPV